MLPVCLCIPIPRHCSRSYLFFFKHTATTEIYTLSLHDALPIYRSSTRGTRIHGCRRSAPTLRFSRNPAPMKDRKSTRLNSSHLGISYAVFCLKKKRTTKNRASQRFTQIASKKR